MDFDEPFICMDCGKQAADGGRCTGCGEDPLLDLRDPEVRMALMDDDERRLQKRDHQMILIAVPIAMVIFGALMLLSPFRWLMTSVEINAGPVALRIVLTMALMGYGISRLLLRLFPTPQRFAFLRPQVYGAVR